MSMGGCSRRLPTLLDGDAALAWHAPGGLPRPPYQWRRLPLRARAPEQHSGTPSRPWQSCLFNQLVLPHSM